MIVNKPIDDQINIEQVESRFNASLLDDLVDYHMRKVVPRLKHFEKLYKGRAKIYKRVKKENKPCNRLANDFCGQIIDTTVGYFLGNPVTVTYNEKKEVREEDKTAEADVGVDLEAIGEDTTEAVQTELDGIFQDNYKDDLFMEWGKEAMIKSLSHLLVYQDERSKTRIVKLKPEDVIIVYENNSTKTAQYKIRLYVISTEDTDTTTIYAEVYSATKMELFKRIENSGSIQATNQGGFEFVEERPHIYGRIPIITLYNN